MPGADASINKIINKVINTLPPQLGGTILISVLCVADVSSYDTIPGLDLWKRDRDAFNFRGVAPVIAHPPCRHWSRMRSFANREHKEIEKRLALFCLNAVRCNGGILKHPASSTLWKYIKHTLQPREMILSVWQSWWGHRMRKHTYLLFNNCSAMQMPIRFDALGNKKLWENNLSPRERSHTPVEFASWLVECLRSSHPNLQGSTALPGADVDQIDL